MFCECPYKACPTFFYPKVNECTIKKERGNRGRDRKYVEDISYHKREDYRKWQTIPVCDHALLLEFIRGKVIAFNLQDSLIFLVVYLCVYNKYMYWESMYCYLDSKHWVCQNMNDEILYCSFKIHPCATYLFDMWI